MNHRTLLMLSTALAAAVTLSACKRDQEQSVMSQPDPAPAPMTPAEPAPAAATASVASVDLGNAVGTDNRVTAPTTTFAPGDTIYAAVTTRTGDPNASVPARLAARWTYQDGQVVHEEGQDLTLAGDGVTTFQISKPDGWPSGRYKVEISLDGNVVSTSDFEVK